MKSKGLETSNDLNMVFRKAKVNDVNQILKVRNSVHENRLSDPNSITKKDVAEFLIKIGKGWVCEVENNILGFAMVNPADKNVWALFVNPDHEGLGIGRRLHETMLNWYFQRKKDKLWLGTSPNTRAEKFYKKCGWKIVGMLGEDELKFEMTYKNWCKSP